MTFKREDFFDWKDLSIDRVASRMEQEPWRIREVLEFISHEMKREEEFKFKLHELKEEYEDKEYQLREEYGYLDE